MIKHPKSDHKTLVFEVCLTVCLYANSIDHSQYKSIKLPIH
jgi:hypothetical protein